MGIGNDYPVGAQIDHVLGRFPAEEREKLQPCIDLAVDIIKSFVLAGIDITMNQYNKLGKNGSSNRQVALGSPNLQDA